MNIRVLNKWCQKNWTDTCKKKKPDYLLTPYTRIDSKWIKDLNIRLETIKLLEEDIGSKLSDITNSNFFSDRSPQARDTHKK